LTWQFKSLGDYLRSFWHSVTREIADTWAEMLVKMAKQSAQKGIISKVVGAIFGAGYANGGIMPGSFKAFASGGISDGPMLGLIGEGRYKREAVVPLPDGRRIPVDLRGRGGGEQKPTVVNINIQAADAKSFLDLARRNKGAIIEAVVGDLQQAGSIRDAIRSYT